LTNLDKKVSWSGYTGNRDGGWFHPREPDRD
jgi:hypothetical protein